MGLYSYGFQGQERDDEEKGAGNSYTTEYREYDSRLGKWLTIDPLIKPSESPYSAYANNPIWFIDPMGADSSLYNKNTGELISKGVTPEDDKTAIWTVDTEADDYDAENPWATAKKLTYSVGETQKTEVGKDNLRSTHPLSGKGWNFGDQVYEEDLLDMTTEFTKHLVRGGLLFYQIGKSLTKENFENSTGYLLGAYEFDEKDLQLAYFASKVNTDCEYDLKSNKRSNLNEIPSYGAVYIGEFSFYNGRLLNNDDYGNISFGLYGRAFGFSLTTLTRAGSIAQTASNFYHFNFKIGDPPRDTYMVKFGFNLLK